jgi:hypothetical protein
MPTHVRVRWFAGAGDLIAHAVYDAAFPEMSGYIRTVCGAPSAHIGATPAETCEACVQVVGPRPGQS